MKTLICIDRDGTLIYDSKEHLFLGSTEDWKEKIQLLPKVVDGLKLLNQLPEARIYMITNQSGVAVKELSSLTEERAKEVCEKVLNILEQLGAPMTGFFSCPHVDDDYVKEHQDFTFSQQLVCECDCIKPKLGMVFDALQKEGLELHNVNVYFIGDRALDVETGLNAGGKGILVPFENEPDEDDKVHELKSEEAYVAKNFEDAAKFILEQESLNNTFKKD